MQKAEIICLGNELLMGVTTNTNATYLGEQLTRLGFEVIRITSVRDDLILASECVQEALKRKPEVLILTGGLGPTYDDIQMEVVSKATGMPLIEYHEAMEMIRDFYAQLGLNLTPERRKMAKFPQNAKILDNKVGAAPGCLVQYNKTEIFCLPGVPTEMKDIFSRNILPYLSKKSQVEIVEHQFIVLNCRESELAPFINKVKKRYQRVYIKSHPKFGDREGITIHIACAGEEAKAKVQEATRELVEAIKTNVSNAQIREIR
ncbi:MAG: molybdopterin-binding protein [Candidatus Heimdallarchaeaceae archaeon]